MIEVKIWNAVAFIESSSARLSRISLTEARISFQCYHTFMRVKIADPWSIHFIDHMHVPVGLLFMWKGSPVCEQSANNYLLAGILLSSQGLRQSQTLQWFDMFYLWSYLRWRLQFRSSRAHQLSSVQPKPHLIISVHSGKVMMWINVELIVLTACMCQQNCYSIYKNSYTGWITHS